jgi:hypothetical protein
VGRPKSAEPGGAKGRGADRYGRGQRDEATGLYEWYEFPEGEGPGVGEPVTWRAILARWGLIEADLHACYGIDLGEPDLLRARSWRWLRARIIGLLSADTRITRALAPSDQRR